MPPDVDLIDVLLVIQMRLTNYTTILRRLADKHLKVAQKLYKSDHNMIVRFERPNAPGDYVFVDGKPLTTSAAERLAAEWCSKLMQNRHDPYCVLSVSSEYLKLV